ncbi:PEP-CTERM-box response regulator transcription factor [Syntrophotalea acetylenivorans]|uniref:PEP-CTERM-box response regulator transcription factor n=1 Tax=Syntrophotalea acetylenivorans TaxID=1842532 RepID=A0A1L3GKQ3_9BACT|nr:PEP-CTERM-box response regulator transcription factor [Syntrophotalea acetylenivorans]APG26465.1 PEP-CTERM-box response regulator transcription factor [Syntrophotalea acetylenivorans]
MEKLLIIDDSPEIRQQLKWGLKKDYKLLLAADVDEGLRLFRSHQPKVVTLDLGLPPDIDGATEGLRGLKEILTDAPGTKVVVLSGNEERENALKAVGLGAYDFYSKPIELAELKTILQRAFHLATLEEENRGLLQATQAEQRSLSGIFGQCVKMEEVFTSIRKVASVDVPVLILGESGTGKELVARALHDNSLRKEGPFVPINCGAIPENLLESELFGHEKGAFTGAQSQVKGKIEYAQGGTLFLDEIGEMPPPLQVKLLRFLQERVIQRVGGRQDIEVDVRVVAATNIDIQQAIQQGTFREDLFYCLGVISVDLPPLREREDDVFLLSHLFLHRYNGEFGKKVRGIGQNAMEALRGYDWPGNVRELENKIKRAVVMADQPFLEPGDLGFVDVAPAEVPAENGQAGGIALAYEGLTLKEARQRLEKELLLIALEKEDGNIVRSAEILGVSRPTLYDLMKKHGL